MSENHFHMMFVVSFLAFMVVRVYYQALARRTAGKFEYLEGRINRGLRLFFGFSYVGFLVAYLFNPRLLSWAVVPLPEGLRWLGALLMFAAVPGIFWVQWALGSNFSSTLHLRTAHTLVTHGPYRWVRHPMYTIFFGQALGILFLTQNVLIGGFYLLTLLLIFATRVKHEEAVMLERFGEPYRQYMHQTGRFLPKLG
jgi:protein-S-isoprenylcysteine O-methyltransferase Ste14